MSPIVEPVPTPTWQRTIPFAGPPDPSGLAVGVQLRQMPTDGFFAFVVPGYDAASTVIFPPPPSGRSEIWKPNAAVLVRVTWRASYETSMTVSYWQGATQPPPGAAIVPIAAIIAQGDELIATFPNSTYDEPAVPERVRVTEIAVLAPS